MTFNLSSSVDSAEPVAPASAAAFPQTESLYDTPTESPTPGQVSQVSSAQVSPRRNIGLYQGLS